jgi:gluconate 2-dehydrogenase gamma chain
MTSQRLRTLRALTARLLPGPPEDPDPGALEAGAAEAIDRFLDAFAGARPPIHAARDGGFVELDAVAELGWRIRLEGSLGLNGREFAGPVEGLAERVDAGLALLDDHCRATYEIDFADAQHEQQDALLVGASGELDAFVGLVLMMTLEVVYGPEQYGANRRGINWKALGWPGFTQPRGFTAEQVSTPDADARGSRDALSELRARLPEDAGWRSDPD